MDLQKTQAEAWWVDFFPAFREMFGPRYPAKETAALADFIIRKLGLKKGDRFLDCPCGIGRISFPLAKKSIRVTGVDITESYLNEIAVKAKRLGLRIKLVHSDMRRIDFDREFDAAGNLGTSFGYFEKESDNELVLKKVFRALKPGGKFLLDVGNRDRIIRQYEPFGLTEIGKTRILQSRHFDTARSVITADWTVMESGREEKVRSVLRLYSYHELITMMRKAGFVDIEGYGSVKGKPIDFDCRMMMVIGTKPK
jgi:ubiquinone/menaquinone biosynthesis C-methylase UbiE